MRRKKRDGWIDRKKEEKEKEEKKKRAIACFCYHFRLNQPPNSLNWADFAPVGELNLRLLRLSSRDLSTLP